MIWCTWNIQLCVLFCHLVNLLLLLYLPCLLKRFVIKEICFSKKMMYILIWYLLLICLHSNGIWMLSKSVLFHKMHRYKNVYNKYRSIGCYMALCHNRGYTKMWVTYLSLYSWVMPFVMWLIYTKMFYQIIKNIIIQIQWDFLFDPTYLGVMVSYSHQLIYIYIKTKLYK